MKNMVSLFALMVAFGLVGISQAMACNFPGGTSAPRPASKGLSKPLLPPIKDPPDPDDGYSKADLNGRYASLATATLFDPTSNRTEYATCVGVVTFDGRGHFTDKEVHSYDGFLVHDEFTGTYTINSDGTGTMHFVGGDGEEYDYEFVVSNGGKSVTFLVMLDVPGLVSNGTLTKQ